MRIIAACIVSFVLTWLLGKVVIPFLHALKAGQTIKEIGPKWHMAKQGTPTMGGIMFIFGTLIAVLVLGWADFMAGNFGALIVFGFAFIYGVIGFIDDYFKVRFHKNEGLTAAQKFLLQLAASILASCCCATVAIWPLSCMFPSSTSPFRFPGFSIWSLPPLS